MNKSLIILIILLIIVIFVATDGLLACTPDVVSATNPFTGEVKVFSDPCKVPFWYIHTHGGVIEFPVQVTK